MLRIWFVLLVVSNPSGKVVQLDSQLIQFKEENHHHQQPALSIIVIVYLLNANHRLVLAF
jgi:hypothetical protein